MPSVLFVCTGNICRSPMAEAVLRHLVRQQGLGDRIHVDSAGTIDWHVGAPPHAGTLAVLQAHGISAAGLRARVLTPADVECFDYAVGMTDAHLSHLRRLASRGRRARLRLLLDGVPDCPLREVPDPYYSGEFDRVFELVYQGCAALLAEVSSALTPGTAATGEGTTGTVPAGQGTTGTVPAGQGSP